MCNYDCMDTANLDRVARRYRDAEAALEAARTELQAEAIDFLHQHSDERGAMTTAVRITGWSREHLRRLREKAEMEALRRKVEELSTTKKPRPAVAASRRQVTHALPEAAPILSPKVATLPYERVQDLADRAAERYPEWVEEIRQEHPHLHERDLDYLIVDAGLQKGFKIPDVAEPPAADFADRPVSGEEAAQFAAVARSRADEMQLKKLDQLAGFAADGAKDFAVMHAGMDMGLLKHDEVYGDRPASSEDEA